MNQSKHNWRRVALAKRRARLLAKDDRRSRQSAESIARTLEDPRIPIAPGSVVAVYFPYSSEPDVALFTDRLVERGVSVLAPNPDFTVVPGTDPFLPLRGSANGPIDVIVLPALAFDGSGTRLGRGRGWYDRAVEHLEQTQDQEPLLVGVCFADEFHRSGVIPQESHDRKVDFVATPEELFEVK